VTRRIKPGIHLLIEAWTSTQGFKGIGSSAPWVTMAAVTEAGRIQSEGSVINASLRKTMPFFCTSFATSVPDEHLSLLGLSVSDF
jgi:hypothetical protein